MNMREKKLPKRETKMNNTRKKKRESVRYEKEKKTLLINVPEFISSMNVIKQKKRREGCKEIENEK